MGLRGESLPRFLAGPGLGLRLHLLRDGAILPEELAPILGASSSLSELSSLPLLLPEWAGGGRVGFSGPKGLRRPDDEDFLLVGGGEGFLLETGDRDFLADLGLGEGDLVCFSFLARGDSLTRCLSFSFLGGSPS